MVLSLPDGAAKKPLYLRISKIPASVRKYQIEPPNLDVYWDLENCRVDNVFQVASNVRYYLRRFLPALSINNFHAYANSQNITDEEREDCTHIGVSLHDIASGELNASDRSMMTDMTLFANDSQPPSFIMAIAGDGDYFQALGALRQRGHTVILAYPHNRTSNELFTVCDYSISWEGFINRTLLVNPFSSLVWAEEPVYD